MTANEYTSDATDSAWHPVASEHDLPLRTIYRGKLGGRELVLWRADDGFINVWENRCLHRGVRLSIGVNEGTELVCRYHGWRYANRSAGCTYIPAHPANSPARTITNRTYPVVERYGLVWTSETPGDGPPDEPLLEGDTLTLRGLPVAAPANVVLDRLLAHHFLPSEVVWEADDDPSTVTRSRRSDASVAIWSSARGHESYAVFFVQPVSESRSVIRGVLDGSPSDPIAVLRHHAARLGALVRLIEAEQPSADDASVPLIEVPVPLPAASPASGRAAKLEVLVTGKELIADSTILFSLRSEGAAPLPTAAPGSHIDVHLGNGLVRQYSLTSGTGPDGKYTIAVKRSPDSAGGSEYLHDSVAVGDVLNISEPRNGFPLRRDASHTIFLAGGIGVTPLAPMASALSAMKVDFSFHHFAASDDAVAFGDVLAEFGERYHTHVGMTSEQTRGRLTELLGEPEPGYQIYCCGPPPMLDAIREIADAAGWPPESVHFEYFTNANAIEMDSSFTVELARSALTLNISAGETILEVLRTNDVPVPSSCETGACGTCQATVLGGEPLHQDVYLNQNERAAGQVMMTCVSRAAGSKLVLDL